MAAASKVRPRSQYDIVIIGGGVVGCALLYELSVIRGLSSRVALLEKHEHLVTGASAGNSGIDHTGFDAKRDTIERQCLQMSGGRKVSVYESLGVPYRRTGALMVAWSEQDMVKLSQMMQQHSTAAAMRRVDKLELMQMEPHLSPTALGAVLIEDEGVVDPWLLPVLMASASAEHGAQVYLNSEVIACERRNAEKDTLPASTGKWRVRCKNGAVITCDHIINCAGLFGDHVHDMMAASDHHSTQSNHFTIQPRKGQFVMYPKTARHLIKHIILPVPKPTTKGIIVFPTVYDNVIVGPTAEDVSDRTDVSVSPEVSRYLVSEGCKIIPALRGHPVISAYTGLRPATLQHTDYVIRSDTDRSFVTVGGIRSTGLSSCLGLAEYVTNLMSVAAAPRCEDESVAAAPRREDESVAAAPRREDESVAAAAGRRHVSSDGWMLVDGGARYHKITHNITAQGLLAGDRRSL